MRIGIIGGGPAGVFTARKFKALMPEADIVLFEATAYGFYAKIRLPECLAGTLPQDKLVMATAEKLVSEGIDYRVAKVVSVDAPAHKIVTADGKEEVFDNLIFATGATAAVPPIPGLAECKQLATLRTLDDIAKMQDKIVAGEKAVVIGGGVLGLEAAFALQKRGMDVSVLECMNALMQNLNFSAGKSQTLKELLEQHGLHIYTGTRIQKVSGDEKAVIELESGEKFECSLLLVSAGIRSNIQLAMQSGLECKRGICVNNRLETNVSGVYAVGDCAEQNGAFGGLWMAAKSQGEALAEIIAGKREEYIYPASRPILKITGMDLSSLAKMD